MPDDGLDDLFPELRVMTDETVKELSYLRERTLKKKVSVYPLVADIFFNNQFVGTGTAEININLEAHSNTLAFISTDFYGHYLDLKPEDIDSDDVDIQLDPRVSEDLSKRVPQWLRYRRKDPNSPVLMRAITNYLCTIGEYDEALEEVEELLSITPGWYMAQNMYGFVLSLIGREEESDKYFHRTVVLMPQH